MDYFLVILFEKKKFPKSQIVYREVRGDFKRLRSTFETMNVMTNVFLKKLKLSNFCIFYDDPKCILNKKKMRFVIGSIVSSIEDDIVDNFINQNLKYKKGGISESKALFTSFPNKNFLSKNIGFLKIDSAF